MASVAKRILSAIAARLAAIDGTGAMVNDLQGRVYRTRAALDISEADLPAVFIYRRGGGDERQIVPPTNNASTIGTVAITYDVVGVVPAGANAGDAAEDLLADIERALERESDVYLQDGGENLLQEPLTLVSAEADPLPDTFTHEIVIVGVRCVYPHKYGDPDHS